MRSPTTKLFLLFLLLIFTIGAAEARGNRNVQAASGYGVTAVTDGTVEIHIVETIGGSIDTSLQAFTDSTADGVIKGISTIIVAFGTLYFLALGYMIMLGQVQEPAPHFFKNMAKFVFISALALNANNYLNVVVSGIHHLESLLATVFSSATGGTSNNVYQSIDAALSKGFSLANRQWITMSQYSFYELNDLISLTIIAVVIVVSTILITIPSAAIIIVAKALLSIMLGIGPIFILMLLFGQFTSQWFDRWFSQVMTYIMQIALVGAVLALAIVIFTVLVNQRLADPNDSAEMFIALELLIVGMLMMKLVQEVNSVAGQLAGGISSAGITLRQVAAAAMAASGGAFLAAKSTRTNANTGNKETRSRLGHMMHGNTMASPAYAKAAMKNLTEKSGWRSPSPKTDPGGSANMSK